MCPTYSCPKPFVAKDNETLSVTRCRDDECTDADKYYCCDKPGECQWFPCPDGYEWAEDYVSKTCKGMTCNQKDDTEVCCQAAVKAQETTTTLLHKLGEFETTTTLLGSAGNQTFGEEIGNHAGREFHGLALAVSLVAYFLRSICDA